MFRSWVAYGVPLPPGTVTFVRYLAESGCTTTHSGVTNKSLDDETKRRDDPHCTAGEVFGLVVHRSVGACAAIQEQVCVGQCSGHLDDAKVGKERHLP